MRLLIYTFLFTCILFLFICCGKKVKFEFAENHIRCLNCNEEFREDYPQYKSVKFVPLETTSACLIKAIQQIYLTDSLIFVLDFEWEIYVFNKEGKFITQIGSKGRGPGEFLRFNTFFIDEKNKQLVIIDEVKKCLIKYTFAGKFINQESISEDYVKYSGRAFLADDNNLLLYNMMNSEENMAYSLLDIDKNEMIGRFFSYDPIKMDKHFYSFSPFPMAKTQEGISFILPLCDTVYNYSDLKFSSKYVIETPAPMPPKEEILPYPTYYSEIRKDVVKKGYFTGFDAFFETTNKIFLRCIHNGLLGYFWGDTSKKEGDYYISTLPSDLNQIPFFSNVIYSFDNTFVSLVEALALNLYNYEFMEENEVNLRFKNMIKNLDESDNPVLFFYEFD